MTPIPSPLDAIIVIAQHRKTLEYCPVLLISFTERYVKVFPESAFASGEHVNWSFDEVILYSQI